jgi:hypothetical protein
MDPYVTDGLTDVLWPPAKISEILLAILGFSATHSTFIFPLHNSPTPPCSLSNGGSVDSIVYRYSYDHRAALGRPVESFELEQGCQRILLPVLGHIISISLGKYPSVRS